MKPTPRTDEFVKHLAKWCEDNLEAEVSEYVAQDGTRGANSAMLKIMRDLERQLSDALEREKALRQELAIEFGNSDRLAKALSAMIKVTEHLNPCAGTLEIARTALALYESGDEPTYTDCPIHGRHEGDCPRC